MKIEKVRNFNQFALAIIVSLGIILMLVFVFMALGELFRDFSRMFDSPQRSQEIVSEEKAKANLEENKRTHLVHFREFDLADTTRQIYVIPVSQTALKEYEAVDESDLFSSTKRSSHSYKNYKSYSYNSNILIYKAKEKEQKTLFNKRVAINGIYYEKVVNEPAVFLSVISKDSSKDGLLDTDDLRSLAIYTTKDDELHILSLPKATYLSYHILKERNELVVRFGLDRDSNGKFDWYEPAVFKHYSLAEKTFTDLINKEQMQQLQAILDGK